MRTITLFLITTISCTVWDARAQDKEMFYSRARALAKQTDPVKATDSMYAIIQDLHLKNSEDVDMLKGEVAMAYLRVNDEAQFEAYIKQIWNKFNQTSYLNMGAEELLNKKINLAYAEKIAAQTVNLYLSYKDDPAAKPAEFPLEDWNRFMQMAMYPYYETYAAILHANGKDKDALFYLRMALKNEDMDGLSPEVAELYSTLLLANGLEDEAWDILLKMAEAGRGSSAMHIQLRKLGVKKLGSEIRTTVFLDSIRQNLEAIHLASLTQKMIVDTQAPDFTVSDLNGKEVSLVKLKGKIVVVDFWATWCLPCIASMPAMENLRKKYPEVLFLFIATKDKASAVNEYCKKNKLPVHTFLDKPAADVASSFKVSGIPTKAIIDRNGNLRFQTTGYSSDQELMLEMEAMIKIVKDL
ncbi:TlpA family protein disulfide reductase [Chitinophaga filiformis]|uniref:TlpA family protein disulfide reductase n=1 Tax=Chitinophaga filiformis TaxID=104663 RepID=A0ABY4HV14_CHIFI|nr:TlpA disulfide reductase family protein [Chitinophaga filiformis]UPK67303.1 TlpA family protein disulfide reductase [Chitinophaga filiformis]